MTTFRRSVQQARSSFRPAKLAQADFIYRRLLEALTPGRRAVGTSWDCRNCEPGGPLRPSNFSNWPTAHPSRPEYQGNLGSGLPHSQAARRGDRLFRAALQRGPATPELYNNLALRAKTRRARRRPDGFRCRLEIRPDYANGQFNRGSLLSRRDVSRRPSKAIVDDRGESARRGGALQLGMAYCEFGRLDDAVARLIAPLQIEPDSPEARRNRGFVWLAQGHFAKGWPKSEWRLDCADSGKCSFLQPKWRTARRWRTNAAGLCRAGAGRYLEL